ncbi:EthD domain-containing protein [Streptomyces sp. NPDC005480]|uniref:EthD domain-containing protein n=1 Tax=Streptomyces sp. NPDC005480 TaxID=3154880 RepID=UPI0033B77509
MFKEYLVLSARDQDRHVECQDYVIHRHAPAVMSHRAFRGLFQRYVAHRPFSIGADASELLLHGSRPDIPLIVEHVCDDASTFRKALQDEDHKAAIRPDEEYIAREFLSAPPMVMEVTESVIFSGPYVGRYHVLDFLKRAPGTSPDDFASWLDEEGRILAATPAFRSVASRRVHNLVHQDQAVYAEDGGTGASTGREWDGVTETWTNSLDGLARLHSEVRARHAGRVDATASFSVITTEHVLIGDRS